MKCHLCGGELEKVVTQFPFKISDSSIVIIKNMPVFQCDRCIEYSIEDFVMEKVDHILSRIDDSAELEIVRYAA